MWDSVQGFAESDGGDCVDGYVAEVVFAGEALGSVCLDFGDLAFPEIHLEASLSYRQTDEEYDALPDLARFVRWLGSWT